ncbi:FGGY-family carbohydrate kinase [Rhodoferax sp.]|uniref:FGGY-family carbohydrate kinase n=1 Tax=Rhodoferax sp. TaxID=50421 RepID=UPI00374CF2DC
MLDLTLVIDIGKSHAKLLLVDDSGTVLEQHGRKNAPVTAPLGYSALDIAGLTGWICSTLAASSLTRRCARAITSTHGAAFVALDNAGLAWPPLDYEFDGYANQTSALHQAYQAQRDGFDATLSPDLPMGLNAARQLYWLQHTHPDAWARTRTLLPYPQYWAWWLSGVAASEVSSLGCHTQLWQPDAQDYSQLAKTQGWAALFASLAPAWQVLGTVRPALAEALGLPKSCEIHVGVHDSNACLARYLASDQDLTVVSSGTWTVLMAPDASTATLDAERDMLCNVNVRGQATPTARFMGGREFAALLDGAPADLGTPDGVDQLLRKQIYALPSFAPQGGPFMQRRGEIMRAGQPIALQDLAAAERSALAALYCAQLTAWLVLQLRPGSQRSTVVVEGPLAHNPLYLGLLQALLPSQHCCASQDAMEGTARGAWMLSRWSQTHSGTSALPLQAAPRLALPGLASYHADWLQRLGQDCAVV